MKKHEVKDKRRLIKKNGTKVTLVKKNDKRITSPSRICCICGEQLSKVNYSNGKVLAKKDHIHVQYSSLLYLDMCKDVTNCYKNLKERGELSE